MVEDLRAEPSNYLDPVTLSKISRLEILAEMVVEGFVNGLHKSPYQGFNVEFSEHRPYNPGDDLRYVDWKVLAKLDRYYIKKFEEETNLKGYIALDVSGSMDFRSGGPVSKIEYARFLAASLAYLMLLQRDSVGLAPFGREVTRLIPPRASRSHLYAIVEQLRSIQPEGETDVAQVLGELGSRIPRRGLVVVVSDLIGEPDVTLRALHNLKHRHHAVILLHVLDPHEINLPWKGYMRLEDPEDRSVLATDPTWLHRDYRERVNRFLEKYREGCLREDIDYALMRTDQPLDDALAAFLARRMNLRRA